ncbi:sodium/bile acid cotransporter-like [Teleopsis dalmanni]|uniref:sodium/bile acid cotransporter-like n=1 Tax=Teleopsis dalmanni TaxID=139649 RepID=UPI0018CFD9E1|nr:sodium/bile acid cotransporter-like [Teleopsis dalmanni]XP_037936795.1 sodium/bile acid cotransporter-like [Teleopsis dalmanni]
MFREKLITAVCLILSNIVTFNAAVHIPPEEGFSASNNVSNIGFYELRPVIINLPTWSVEFNDVKINMSMKETKEIPLTINHIDSNWGDDYEFHIIPEDTSLLEIDHVIRAADIPKGVKSWSGNFSVTAIFLGETKVKVELHRPNYAPERSMESISIIILRKEGALDQIFKVCVACLVMVLYINFGAALELDALKRIVLRPVGPAIGFIGQFIVMPLLSFFIGYFLFHDMIELRLGLFFTGSTPGGGASNIFTVILNGNLNLSITMTAISNLAAFGMMPLWIFTLGALIFHDGNFAIPYGTIATMSCSLVLPLCIGIALQKYAPEATKKMSKLLKPISLALILFITIFAFTVNSYIFKLFSWKIIIASSALPWIGYLIGWLLATICRQNAKDALTIAIETGIQNTGIAIFMLNFSLPQPQADMTSAVPVASSMMTPLPLLLLYLIRKCFCRTSIEEVEEAPTKELGLNEVEAIVEKQKSKLPVEKNTNSTYSTDTTDA